MFLGQVDSRFPRRLGPVRSFLLTGGRGQIGGFLRGRFFFMSQLESAV